MATWVGDDNTLIVLVVDDGTQTVNDNIYRRFHAARAALHRTEEMARLMADLKRDVEKYISHPRFLAPPAPVRYPDQSEFLSLPIGAHHKIMSHLRRIHQRA